MSHPFWQLLGAIGCKDFNSETTELIASVLMKFPAIPLESLVSKYMLNLQLSRNYRKLGNLRLYNRAVAAVLMNASLACGFEWTLHAHSLLWKKSPLHQQMTGKSILYSILARQRNAADKGMSARKAKRSAKEEHFDGQPRDKKKPNPIARFKLEEN